MKSAASLQFCQTAADQRHVDRLPILIVQSNSELRFTSHDRGSDVAVQQVDHVHRRPDAPAGTIWQHVLLPVHRWSTEACHFHFQGPCWKLQEVGCSKGTPISSLCSSIFHWPNLGQGEGKLHAFAHPSSLPSLENISISCCLRRTKAITSDPSHPAYPMFDLLPSGRRYRSIKSRTSRLMNSFFPWAIRTVNTQGHLHR